MKIYQFILLVIVLVGFAFWVGGKLNKEVVYKQVKEQVVLDNLKGKINELKGQLVGEIKSCESAGFDESYGLITYDPHKTNKNVQIASIGSYQFKKSTVQYYYKTLYNQEITGKEAVLIALDDEKAGELATKIIFDTDDGLSNWINCAKKNNSRTKLEVINSLMK